MYQDLDQDKEATGQNQEYSSVFVFSLESPFPLITFYYKRINFTLIFVLEMNMRIISMC